MTIQPFYLYETQLTSDIITHKYQSCPTYLHRVLLTVLFISTCGINNEVWSLSFPQDNSQVLMIAENDRFIISYSSHAVEKFYGCLKCKTIMIHFQSLDNLSTQIQFAPVYNQYNLNFHLPTIAWLHWADDTFLFLQSSISSASNICEAW